MKYATKKEVEKITDALLELTTQVEEIARWQTYYSIKENLKDITPEMKKEVLEHSKRHITHILYKNMFKEGEKET